MSLLSHAPRGIHLLGGETECRPTIVGVDRRLEADSQRGDHRGAGLEVEALHASASSRQSAGGPDCPVRDRPPVRRAVLEPDDDLRLEGLGPEGLHGSWTLRAGTGDKSTRDLELAQVERRAGSPQQRTDAAGPGRKIGGQRAPPPQGEPLIGDLGGERCDRLDEIGPAAVGRIGLVRDAPQQAEAGRAE